MSEITRERIKAALAAPMPDGCTVLDYLEDAVPDKASLKELGINIENYALSYFRDEIYDDFYSLIITAILKSSPSSPRNEGGGK